MQTPFNSLQNSYSESQEIGLSEEESSFTDNLASFFQQFGAYHQVEKKHTPAPPATSKAIDVQKLAEFFTAIEKPLEASRHSAIAFDPWRVIALGRNEVRVVSILSWLLDPCGSHGYGPALQQGLLSHINRHIPAFPTHSRNRCLVRSEINLNGESGNRVDIEIDAENFHLVIEAKIDAIEQPRQVERYCEQARKRATRQGCPWALIYLTPHGRKPSHEDENLLCLSWYQLSHILQDSMKNHQNSRDDDLLAIQGNADFFVKTYLNYTRSF